MHQQLDIDITQLSITPRLLLTEFDRRAVAYDIMSTGAQYVCIAYRDTAGVQRYLQNVVTDATSAVAVRIADNKASTYALAERLAIPIPATETYQTEDQ